MLILAFSTHINTHTAIHNTQSTKESNFQKFNILFDVYSALNALLASMRTDERTDNEAATRKRIQT